MSNVLLISADTTISEIFQNAFDTAGLKISLTHSSGNCDFGQSAGSRPVLVIYHLQDTTDKTAQLINCLEGKPADIPVILAGESPSTKTYQQFEYLGVRDIVSISDTQHLILIVRRELAGLEIVSELSMLKASLSGSDNRLTHLIDSADNAIAFVQDGMHMHANQAYADIFGFRDTEELASRPLLDLIAENYQTDFKKVIQQMTTLSTEQHLELDCKRADSSSFRALFVFSPASFEGEACLQLQVDNLEFEHKARMLSDQDPDTGLNSRHHFMHDLIRFFGKKDTQSQSVYLLYILVDGFTDLKQKHGLLNTDIILNEMAQILRSQIKSNMIPYRYGDHSFTIMIESDNQQLARVVAETLIRLISMHNYQSIADVLSPTVSIGISSNRGFDSDDEETQANRLLENAYQACRVIYENAGNGYMDFENLQQLRDKDVEIEKIDDTTHLREMLSHALEHDHFRLLYQPVISTNGNTGEYYSVLLRLLDPENQEIRPHYFLKQAISFGLMRDIDRWVIKQAIESLALQRRNGNRTRFFIPLSQSAIGDDTLLLWIVDCLRDTNAKGSWITFQFLYKDIKKDSLSAEKLFQGLKKINCGISINQYENTASGRKILERLPVDYLKFNKAEAQNLLAENCSNPLDLTGLSNHREISTIVHQIENSEDLTMCWQGGINFIQGSFLQEPAARLASSGQ